MPKKQVQKHTNFLALVGQPVFYLLIHTTSALSALLLILLCPVSKPTFRLTSKLKIFILLLVLSALSYTFYLTIFKDLPDPHLLKRYPSQLTTQILDRNGVLLYKIYKDENRTLVKIQDLPPHVINAFLIAEDKDFYRHHGYSVSGMFRALYNNLLHHRLEGGSTITQQLIKNTLLSSEKTLTRKIKEIILSVRTEQIYPKDQILEMYLNQVGFGGPVYGIQEASATYFNKEAKHLTIAQASLLAGITKAPTRYSPFSDEPHLATARQKTILKLMIDNQKITPEEYRQALSEEITLNPKRTEIIAPHFVMYVKQLLENEYGENFLYQGGVKVYTTLDSRLQEFVQKTVTDEVRKLSKLHVGNGASLVTDPQNGEILAMVGSVDYFDAKNKGQVNLTHTPRQPGSAIKPLNYALYFENGNSQNALITDSPLTISVPGQAPWSPKNYDGKFHGQVTLKQALASSYNIPSVIILLKNGINEFATFGQKLGITTWEDRSRYGFSMALGSLETRMTDLATAYSTFANNGVTTPLKAVIKIEKPNGTTISYSNCTANLSSNTLSVNAQDTCLPSQNISPQTAKYISDILSDNTARSPAFGPNSILNIKKDRVSVKTGTSNDLKDNWTIGYNQNFLVSTWVGNNDNTPMSKIASGITGASPIWAKIFNHLLENHPSHSNL